MKFQDVCGSVEAGRPVAVPDGFAASVLKAAVAARKDREIGLFQFWRIQAALRNQRQLSRIYAGVIDEAISAGLCASDAEADGFDWNSLLAFIEKLLPLILQLISIFS